jgi:hypothetical protein
MATVHFTTNEKFEAKVRKLAADHDITLKDTERQIISADGTVNGGTYNLGYGGNWANNIAYDANAATIQTALEGIFAAGDVFCIGGVLPGAAVTVRWAGTEQYKDIGLLEINIDSLTGGGEYKVEASKKGRGEALARRLENAYDIIEGALLSRGLTVVQISTWARGEEFQLDLATYWYGKDEGWGGRFEDESDWIAVFNREKELETIPIVSNDGVLLASGAGIVAEGIDMIKTNAALGIHP